MAAEKQAQQAKQEPAGFLTPADCDIGASPQMAKGSVYSKRHGGGGKHSPIVHADRFKVGWKKQQ